MAYMKTTSPFLYDNSSGDIIGVKDPDGSELLFWRAPHLGSFTDLSIQSASANTATDMECDTTDISRGISMSANSRITVSRSAVYNIQFSAQIRNTGNDERTVSIWLANASGNIADSNTFVTVPKKHAGDDGYVVAAWNYFVEMEAGTWVKLVWSVNGADVTLHYASDQVTPTRPKTPSVILTVVEVAPLA